MQDKTWGPSTRPGLEQGEAMGARLIRHEGESEGEAWRKAFNWGNWSNVARFFAGMVLVLMIELWLGSRLGLGEKFS